MLIKKLSFSFLSTGFRDRQLLGADLRSNSAGQEQLRRDGQSDSPAAIPAAAIPAAARPGCP